MFKRLPIKTKLRAVVLLTTAIALAVTCAVFILYERFTAREFETSRLKSLGLITAQNNTAPLAFGNEEDARRFLTSLGSESNVRAAALYDSKGKLFARYPQDLDPARLPAFPGPEGITLAHGHMLLFTPVREGLRRYGTLFLESDLFQMRQRLRIYIPIALLVFLGAMAIAFVIGGLLERNISAPILALTAAAHAVADRDDYSVRAPSLSSDELGLLTDAFNKMMSEAEQHREQLNAQLTERIRAESALRESEARFRTLSDNIAQLAWMANAQGEILWYNQRWFDYTGTTLEQMQGWGWGKVHDPNHLERVTAKWKHHLARGQEWEDTFPLRGKDGIFRWFLSRAVPIRDASGKVVRWFGTNTDITELKETQEALEQARTHLEDTVHQRTAELRESLGELEAYSYSVTHDMRAPLRAMTAYAGALLEDFGPKIPPVAADYVNKIISASVRMDQLITDVLAYSRVARAERILKPIDTHSLFTEIIQQYPSLQSPNAEIHIAGPLPAVMGEEASLSQCVSNLLLNGVKFVPSGVKPVIHIRAEIITAPDSAAPVQEASLPAVRLWFEDNGIGIEDKDLQRIFGIFERVHPREAYEGTGIGLAIVKKAVERMGGLAGVASTPGKGSRFWIQLKKA